MEDKFFEIREGEDSMKPTLRDMFACAALTGVMANPDRYKIPVGGSMIEFAYGVAEKMIEEKLKRDREDKHEKI